MSLDIRLKSTIGRAAAFAIGAAAMTVPIVANADELAQQLVDDLGSAFGKHHARAVHAKGIILNGSFAPAPDASTLSTAAVFANGTIPVTVRFSDFTGIPDIPDPANDATPRGFAIKFRIGDRAVLDIVAHSFNGFPSATSDEFGALLRAIATSGPGAAKPTPVELFLGSHPAAQTFLTTQKPPPVSYATAAYYGVNSIAFTNRQTGRVFVRYRFVPQAGEHYLDEAAQKSQGPNYLSEEIAKRLAGAPIQFDWFAQIAEPGDKIDDPSIAWPESRKLVKLGTINIAGMAPDQAAADKALLFLPGNLPPGMEVADPMLNVRSAAYPISFAGRQ